MVKNYKDLKVWQLAVELGVQSIEFAKDLNQNGMYHIGNHIIKTSISIASNIAEGFGRRNDKEFARFSYFALGSLHELETQLIICTKLGFLQKDLFETLEEKIAQLGKMLNSLIQYLKTNQR